jgi:hypothetical protein
MTQDEDNPETLVTLDKEDPGRRQSRDTGNIGQTRPRTKTMFLVCPMLPVSLDCLRHVSCLSNVTSVSGLSSSWVLFVQCYQCLWIVFVLGLVCPMLPVSLDCPLVTLDKQETGRRQSKDTGNIGQTRPRTKTIQRHW